jgi:hypothetical protein
LAADDLTVPEDLDAQVGWRAIRGKASRARQGNLDEAEALAREADALCAGTEDPRAPREGARRSRRGPSPGGPAAGVEDGARGGRRLHERKGNLPAAERIRRRLDDLGPN